LYYDDDQTVRLTEDRPMTRLTFDAKPAAPIRVVASGDGAPITLVLWAKDPNDPGWRMLETATSGQHPTIFDRAGDQKRAYRLDVSGAATGKVHVRLSCQAETHDVCAVQRQPNDVCGGIGRTRIETDCDQGLYCNLVRKTCGYGDQGGTCEKPPTFCVEIYQPVCGCDRETYGNECEARRAQMSVWRDGPCELLPEPQQ
jgi:hypothetical protein